MKYEILLSTPAGTAVEHDSFIVEAERDHDGALVVVMHDENGDLSGEKTYARGYWLSYELVELPTAEATVMMQKMADAFRLEVDRKYPTD